MQQKTGYKWKTSEISGISQELERLEKSQVVLQRTERNRNSNRIECRHSTA